MARLIREGELSAREAMDAHLAHIERANPKVNAIVTLIAEEARRAASLADESQAQGRLLGPLHGLPTAHKDLQPTKGIRTTFGSRIFKDFVPAEDSPLVARIKSTGAIALGKTNTPEFGAGSQTFNEVFGATLNPWDPTKTCGGSSGGGAGLPHATDRGRHRPRGFAPQPGQFLRRSGVSPLRGMHTGDGLGAI